MPLRYGLGAKKRILAIYGTLTPRSGTKHVHMSSYSMHEKRRTVLIHYHLIQVKLEKVES